MPRYRLNDHPCVDIATRRFDARDATITDQHIGDFRQLVKFNTALRRTAGIAPCNCIMAGCCTVFVPKTRKNGQIGRIEI